MPTLLDRTGVSCRADRAPDAPKRKQTVRPAGRATRVVCPDPVPPLRPEAGCLQRWLDLNA